MIKGASHLSTVGPAGRTVSVTPSGITYSRLGAGPKIILLHGWCLNRALWMYQEEALASSFEVICPDLPGFGASAGLDGPYVIKRFGDVLSALFDELRLESAHVGGFAFGAAVAMTAAAADDSRISSLALVAPPSGACAPYERMPRAMRRDWPKFAQLSAAAVVKQPHSDAEMRWLEDMFRGTPLHVAIATATLLAAFEPVDVAPSVNVPTLLIHGAQDDVVPVSVSESCRRLLRDGQLTVVGESGHLVPLDQREETTRLMMEFFSAS